ncbi:MAG: S41 family peptidase [Imperialibacter sp.]|uniref:S41 family peptidase n=1 Tax=Imperialibacter sp. TaxID=2038411 RepID=UPI0032ED3C73
MNFPKRSSLFVAMMAASLLFAASCNKDDDPTELSAEAESFLTEILDIMEANSINRDKIDWTVFREKVFAKAIGAKSIEDTYIAVEEALTLLGDNHSSYRKSGGAGTIFVGQLSCEGQNNVLPTIPDNIGYVKVNFFSGGSADGAALSFARAIQLQIKTQDSEDNIGWIVDVRNNGGGNMWPMIAGIGPILGEGVAGYFVYPDGSEESWGYQAGASTLNGSAVTTLTEPYELMKDNPKVAVLLNNGIASSGEIVAISFIGRENTKSFGEATCGLSTSNTAYQISDDSLLILTTAYQADRNKNVFGVPIEPDGPTSSEASINRAIAWLQGE